MEKIKIREDNKKVYKLAYIILGIYASVIAYVNIMNTQNIVLLYSLLISTVVFLLSLIVLLVFKRKRHTVEAIGYSLRIKEPVDSSYNVKNQRGTDYNRFTIFGDDELIYKVLMEEHIRAHIEEDDFFPGYTNAHIEREIKELYADYKLYNNREKLLKKILA